MGRPIRPKGVCQIANGFISADPAICGEIVRFGSAGENRVDQNISGAKLRRQTLCDRVDCGLTEQLRATGVRLIVGLTSAGRVAPDLPVPGLLVAAGAIRDEGTSYHYLPPDENATCPLFLTAPIARELSTSGFAVRTGIVWTTDAPYRETSGQLQHWAQKGALAVEMQAASLFAFGRARGVNVAVVARVSNAVDHDGEQFDTGSHDEGLKILRALSRAGRLILEREARSGAVSSLEAER